MSEDVMTGRMVAHNVAISQLYARYCWALSTHDWDAMDAMFASDATIDAAAFGGACLVWPQFKKYMAEALGSARTFYTATGVVADVNGDGAETKAAFVANLSFDAPDGGQIEISEGGWFLDTLGFSGGAWRVVSRLEKCGFMTTTAVSATR